MTRDDWTRGLVDAFNAGGPHAAGDMIDVLSSLLADVLSGMEPERGRQAWQRFVEVMTQRLRDQRAGAPSRAERGDALYRAALRIEDGRYRTALAQGQTGSTPTHTTGD